MEEEGRSAVHRAGRSLAGTEADEGNREESVELPAAAVKGPEEEGQEQILHQGQAQDQVATCSVSHRVSKMSQSSSSMQNQGKIWAD